MIWKVHESDFGIMSAAHQVLEGEDLQLIEELDVMISQTVPELESMIYLLVSLSR